MLPDASPQVVTDFRRFWAGHTVSVVGSHVSAVALPLIAALTLGAGAAGVSAVATAAYLPNVVLPLLAGHWLQTRKRRRAMITADLVRFAALLLIPISYALGWLSVPFLVGIALVVGAASVVFDIGGFAYLPTLVPQAYLPKANRAMQGSTTAAQVAGPGLAGLLVQIVGAPFAMLLDAISYLASAYGVAAAKQPEPDPEPTPATSVFDGLRQLGANPFLRALTAHAAIYNGAAQILVVNLVIFAVTDRGLSAGAYGLAISAAGVGAFAGTMLALRLAARFGYGRAFALSLVLSTGAPLLIAVLPGTGTPFAAALAAVELISGVGLGSANVLSVTLRQIVAPHGTIARTNGGYRLITFGVLPVGSALAGVLGQLVGARWGVAIGAAGLAASAVPMFARRIRTLRTPESARAVVEPVRDLALATADR
ncbi:MFS family permease [Hamadaea flava]|uniref:MFS transporter n=1 Tax=Hamadaea flava TaxID=1742688 RepID=A0ABV8LVZ9_9ACTN|nr:MFS transporter [Hamadaea flava]MCP2329208.1 MFS family permease [Hamadaea flava]